MRAALWDRDEWVDYCAAPVEDQVAMQLGRIAVRRFLGGNRLPPIDADSFTWEGHGCVPGTNVEVTTLVMGDAQDPLTAALQVHPHRRGDGLGYVLAFVRADDLDGDDGLAVTLVGWCTDTDLTAADHSDYSVCVMGAQQLRPLPQLVPPRVRRDSTA